MSKSIYDAVWPLHVLLKFTGYGLFTVDTKTLTVKFTKCDGIFLALSIFVSALLNYIYYESVFVMKCHNSEIVKIFFPAISYVNCCILIFTKVWHFCHRKNFGKFLRLMNEIDQDFTFVGVRFDYSQQRNVIVKLLLLVNGLQVAASVFSYIAQSYYNMGITWNVFLFVSWGFFLNSVMVNQFIAAVSAVKGRFKAINDIIR